MVIEEAIKYGKEKLKDNLYTDSFRESIELLSFLINKDISYILTNLKTHLDEKTEREFLDIINRREKNEPIQYILKSANFYGREFYVDERVLIPRNETELSVEKILKIANEKDFHKILEIGAGSGAICVTLALESKSLKVFASDISEDALEVVKINREKYHAENLKLIKSNLFENISESFDIIFSNPPYIKTAEIENLQKEVGFEPKLALDGGDDGLNFYREITKKSCEYLKKGGFLCFEIGYDQGEDVKKILRENSYKNIEILKDFQGYDRVITAEVK